MLSSAIGLHLCKLRASSKWRAGPLILTLISLGAIYFSGIRDVPFHPDESTYLYMSADLETWLTAPGSLAWNPERPQEARQRYRLLDAPLTRYILGIALRLSGHASLVNDWNWELDWETNATVGALPPGSLLLAGRLAASLLFPMTLGLVYRYANAMDGRLAGIAAVLALGTNALALLHTRRAMAEGPLLFGVSAVIASWLIAPRRPWLAGLAMSLAFNAKASTLALLPVGLLAAAWIPSPQKTGLAQSLKNVMICLFFFILATAAMNPVAWRQPAAVIHAAVRARSDLLQRQVSDTGQLAPSKVLDGPLERGLALLGHLYLTPPSFAEVGNYREQTAAQELAYLGKPWNRLLRNPVGAGFGMFFTALGLGAAARQVTTKHNPRRRIVLLALSGTFLQAFGLIVAVPLPWQRYVIPVLPFICLWVGTGVSWALTFIPNTRAAYAGSPGGAAG